MYLTVLSRRGVIFSFLMDHVATLKSRSWCAVYPVLKFTSTNYHSLLPLALYYFWSLSETYLLGGYLRLCKAISSKTAFSHIENPLIDRYIVDFFEIPYYLQPFLNPVPFSNIERYQLWMSGSGVSATHTAAFSDVPYLYFENLLLECCIPSSLQIPRFVNHFVAPSRFIIFESFYIHLWYGSTFGLPTAVDSDVACLRIEIPLQERCVDFFRDTSLCYRYHCILAIWVILADVCSICMKVVFRRFMRVSFLLNCMLVHLKSVF